MTGAAICVPTIRQKLRAVADQTRAEIEGRSRLCRRGMEWASVPLPHRMALLLLAGLDGDLQSLARRAWAEFTPSEQAAIQVAIRSMHDSLSKAQALQVRA